MSKFPSMPLFWDSFFAKTAGISDDAAHAYIFLLGHAWIRGGALPDDDNHLARLARVSRQKWFHIKAEVMPYWALYDGTWRNKRLDEELSFVTMVAQKRRTSGKIGGLARVANLQQKQLEFSSKCSSDAQPPTPTPIKKEKNTKKEKPNSVLEILMVGGGLSEQTAKDVLDYRKAKKVVCTPRAIQMLAKQLFDWGDPEAAAATMIRKNWTGCEAAWLENLGMKRPTNGHLHPNGSSSSIFVKRDTPQWDAWQTWWMKTKGKSMPGGDGWHCPSEWPPDWGTN